MNNLIKLIANIKRDQKRTGTDYTGVVTRVDGGTAYVRLTGSDIMDTPVRMTIDAKPGDKVRVRINSGKAWITGNDTAPPTDDTRANEAYELASKTRKNLPIVIRNETTKMVEDGELDIGNDVERIVIEHCLANNRVIPADQTFADIQYTPWSTTMPTFVHGKFCWSRIVIYYKDGSVKYGDPYYDMGAQATAETVIAVRIAQDAADTADEIAQAAAATAGEKRRVFNSTPVPPYDVNDMWFDGAHGVIYLCATAKAEGETFAQNDWTVYSTDVSNHFWYDSSGAHVAENQGDVTTGASQTISSNGTVMMRNGKIITSWTGTRTGDAAINFYDMTSSVARNSDLVASFGHGGITHYVNNIVCQALTPSGLSFYTPDANNHPEAVFGSSGVNLYANGKLGMALTSGNMKFYDSDGSTELAEFGSSGATIGRDGDFRVSVGRSLIKMSDPSGATGFKVSLANNTSPRPISESYSISSNNSVDFYAPISQTDITFREHITGSDAMQSVTKTSTELPVGSSFTFSGTTLKITRVSEDQFNASITSGDAYLTVDYSMIIDTAKVNFNGGNNILWSGVSLVGAENIINLSESVSEQLTGIVLVWSEYDSGNALDFGWAFTYIPKESLSIITVAICTGLFFSPTKSVLGTKFVSVRNTGIIGSGANTSTSYPIINSIYANNARWALRYVLGV